MFTPENGKNKDDDDDNDDKDDDDGEDDVDMRRERVVLKNLKPSSKYEVRSLVSFDLI